MDVDWNNSSHWNENRMQRKNRKADKGEKILATAKQSVITG